MSALAALVLGTVVGWAFLRDDGSSPSASPTTTTTLAPTTTTTIVLASTADLTAALTAASRRLTGRRPSADDVSAFVAQYHQDEVAHSATTPAAAADAYVRLHHPAEVQAYGYLEDALCFGERLLPHGKKADCS